MISAEEVEKVLVSLGSPFKLTDFKENIFESFPWLCNFYNERPTKLDEITSRNLNEILQYLPVVCNNKELLLVSLEELVCFKSNEKFLGLIGLIQKCLQSLPTNFVSITHAYDILCAHLESYPLNKDSSECVITLKEDETCSKVRNVVKVFLSYFSYFVDMVQVRLANYPNDAATRKASDEFSLILLRVFGGPLGHLYLDCDQESCEVLCLSLFEKLQTDVITYILKIVDWKNREIAQKMNRQKHKYLTKEDVDDDDGDNGDLEGRTHDYIETGCGVLCYLIFRDSYLGDLVPQVFSKSYIFEVLLPIISHLFEDTPISMFLVNKGCTLLLNLLKNLGECGLQSIEDDTTLKTFVKKLTNIMTRCRVRDVMNECALCINAILWALRPTDRLYFLSSILRSTESPSIRGFVVTAIKNQLSEMGVEAFNFEVLDCLLRHLFSRSLLKSEEVTTGIVNHMDRLMPTLNFLIYLIIKYHNNVQDSRFDSIIEFAQREFLEPLKAEIESFKRTCLVEMDALQCGLETGDMASNNVTVVNEDADVPTMLNREAILKKHLVNLDLLNSSVARVESLLANPGEGITMPKAPPETVAPSEVFEPIRSRWQINTRLAPFEHRH